MLFSSENDGIAITVDIIKQRSLRFYKLFYIQRKTMNKFYISLALLVAPFALIADEATVQDTTKKEVKNEAPKSDAKNESSKEVTKAPAAPAEDATTVEFKASEAALKVATDNYKKEASEPNKKALEAAQADHAAKKAAHDAAHPGYFDSAKKAYFAQIDNVRSLIAGNQLTAVAVAAVSAFALGYGVCTYYASSEEEVQF